MLEPLLWIAIGTLIGAGLTFGWVWWAWRDQPITTIPLEEMRVKNPIDGQIDHVTRVDEDGVIYVEASP